MTNLGTLSPSDNFSYGVSITMRDKSWDRRTTPTSRDAKAFIYSGGAMTQVPGLGGNYYDFANGINNLGQVVGISGRSNGVTHAYLYSGGVTADLGSLGGTGGYSERTEFNDHTQIVGVSNNAGATAASSGRAGT